MSRWQVNDAPDIIMTFPISPMGQMSINDLNVQTLEFFTLRLAFWRNG
ncbi:hypothetical protein [Shewanella atlantica]